jgi:ribosomal protein L7/L12
MSAQSPKPLPPAVIAALQQGKLIEAIRLLRASGGNIDLAQAKKAIEQHLDRSKVARATVNEAVGSLARIPAVAEALRKGNKIDAIRILREKTGLGLKEAKDAVDHFPGFEQPKAQEQPQAAKVTPKLARPGLAPGEEPNRGGGQWLLIALIIIGALAYYLYHHFG